jgi:GT2 family glycosyltransferase
MLQVDLIPLSLNNMYACTDQPRHCSSAIDVFDFKLPYRTNFGGYKPIKFKMFKNDNLIHSFGIVYRVVAISQSIFRKINGHSNSFFGWGGEDDDLLYRVAKAGLDVVRFEPEVAAYHMLSHLKENPNPDRHRLLNAGRDLLLIDGLNNLNYTLLTYQLNALYTLIKVNV